MAVVLPHKFKDGVGEVASGVQVLENDEALKAAIEAAQALLVPVEGQTGLSVQIGHVAKTIPAGWSTQAVAFAKAWPAASLLTIVFPTAGAGASIISHKVSSWNLAGASIEIDSTVEQSITFYWVTIGR